jgi:beta-lactamase class A
MLTRRGIVAGGTGLVVAGCAAAEQAPLLAVQPERESDYLERFRWVADHVGGRLGVCAIDTGSGQRIGYRMGQRFAMASTFKWLLAAAVLWNHQADPTVLESQRIVFRERDLLGHAPAAREAMESSTQSLGGERVAGMTLARLCQAAVEVSDNTAANLLLGHIGGPGVLTVFLRASGDDVTRLDRFEPDLNENAPGDERDTTTPEAMAQTMARILATDEVLVKRSRDLLVGWLRASATGLNRLRGGLPAEWNAGDKTGTGGNGSHNDVAIAFPPGRAPIVIASYISESTVPDGVKATAHTEVARIVAKEFG